VEADREPGLVGQLLQLDLPEPYTRTIRAAAVCRDRQFPCIWIALSPHAFEPATNRLHGELSGVARDPDTDEAGIGGDISLPESDAARGSQRGAVRNVVGFAAVQSPAN
jgi:hypothetical protein